MKRRQVIKKIQDQAKKDGLSFEVSELTNHTGVTVDGLRSTIGRHSEIPDNTAKKFWDQFESKFGKGWWR